MLDSVPPRQSPDQPWRSEGAPPPSPPQPPRRRQAYRLAAAPATLDAVDDEMRRIVDECYDRACRLLTEHRPKFDALTTALLEQETLEEDEAYRTAGIPLIPKPEA